jgi:hypothetical protein
MQLTYQQCISTKTAEFIEELGAVTRVSSARYREMRRAFVQLHVCRATHLARWGEAKRLRISLQSGRQLNATADV